MATAKDIWDVIREMYPDYVIDYYMKMTTLLQELDLSVAEQWDCPMFDTSVENKRVYEFLAKLNSKLNDVTDESLAADHCPHMQHLRRS